MLTRSVATIKDRREKLEQGARNGDTNSIRRILEDSSPEDRQLLVNTIRAHTVPRESASVSDETLVRLAAYLLDRDTDVNLKNENGVTALWSACYQGDVRLASLLVCRGADIDVRGSRDLARTHGDRSPIVVFLDSVTRPPRERQQAHWLRRILFHVAGRRSENPGSARHQITADRFLPERIAAYVMPAANAEYPQSNSI